MFVTYVMNQFGSECQEDHAEAEDQNQTQPVVQMVIALKAQSVSELEISNNASGSTMSLRTANTKFSHNLQRQLKFLSTTTVSTLFGVE